MSACCLITVCMYEEKPEGHDKGNILAVADHFLAIQ